MYTYGGELTHYGILGMHWGVRRYQPYSQGYQAKGKGGKYVGDKSKKRERDPHANMTYNEKWKRWEHNDYRRAHNKDEYKKKHYEMSDREIKARVDRIKNERKYVDEYEDSVKNKGKRIVLATLAVTATAAKAYDLYKKFKGKGKSGPLLVKLVK